jgi:hypothetical protein
MAMVVMAANAAGIPGGQIFQSSDKPKYRIGWTVIACLIAMGILFCICANIQYWVLNRRLDRSDDAEHVSDEGSELVPQNKYHM